VARPPKEGLDYFLLDCALDDKFRLIEAEFGLTGFAVVVKLLQSIYGGNGYYREWTEEVALLFASDCKVGGSVVSEIVSASIKRGIFDNKIFEEYQVLTSRGIQKRYLEAVKRRKVLTVKKQYLLVNVAQLIDNVNITVVYVDINPQNVSVNPQSKVEKSKAEYMDSLSEQSPDVKKPKKIFSTDSDEMKLSLLLADRMQKNNPKCKLPKDFQGWCKHIDLMVRVDGRTQKEIQDIILFSQKDSFWSANILSTGKLREKFDQLLLRQKNGNKANNSNANFENSSYDLDELEAMIASGKYMK